MALSTCLLSTLVLSGKITSIANNVSTNIIMSTINTTTMSIKRMIGYILSHDNGNCVIDVLKQTDLAFTVKIIEEFIKEQDMSNVHSSIQCALHGVNEILLVIHDEVQQIQLQLAYHKTKYFSGWREFVCSVNPKSVESNSKILQHRYNILFELLKIYKI